MLDPSMNKLLKKIDNRYLLVNIAAKRAREIAEQAEQMDEPVNEKPVKTALVEISDGTIVVN